MNQHCEWSDEELASAWIARYSQARTTIVSVENPDLQVAQSKRIDLDTAWAFDALNELVTRIPSHAWKIILLILNRASSDEAVLDNLAAGPLESLIARHGRDVITWVEAEARKNGAFKDVLRGVWQNMIPELIWQRVQKAAGE